MKILCRDYISTTRHAILFKLNDIDLITNSPIHQNSMRLIAITQYSYHEFAVYMTMTMDDCMTRFFIVTFLYGLIWILLNSICAHKCRVLTDANTNTYTHTHIYYTHPTHTMKRNWCINEWVKQISKNQPIELWTLTDCIKSDSIVFIFSYKLTIFISFFSPFQIIVFEYIMYWLIANVWWKFDT